MDIKTIQNQLTEKHQLFSDFVGSLSSDEFSFRKSDKWTAGEQLEHILLSVRPLRQALSLPKFILKLIWGQSNRAGRDYEGLVNKYLSKLESGGRATGRFIPKAVPVEKRNRIRRALDHELRRLCAGLDSFTEKELDQYVLPHPLLGKLTLREMMFFTIYHVQHHEVLTKKNLEQ